MYIVYINCVVYIQPPIGTSAMRVFITRLRTIDKDQQKRGCNKYLRGCDTNDLLNSQQRDNV